jgi:hypothetical protein
MIVLRFPGSCKAVIIEFPTSRPEGGQVLGNSLFSNIDAGKEMGYYRVTAPQMKYDIEPGWFFEELPGNITYPMQSDGEGVGCMGYATA